MSALLLPVSLSRPGLAQVDTLDTSVSGDLVLSTVLTDISTAFSTEDYPTAAEFLPDGRLVILGQTTGEILVWSGAGAPIIRGAIPVNVSSERGLLGLAVDPEFLTTHRLYFYYSAEGSPATNRHRVAYATIDPATSAVDVANRVEILSGMYGPANHNGGGLAFGPDGNLYVGVGDTGCNCGCAPGGGDNYFPTCLTNLNGKILRIDREGGTPATNPLAGILDVPACGASIDCSADGQHHFPDPAVTGAPAAPIYIWGLRNPWRFSFDGQTGHLWIGDVGEVTYEEITISRGPGEHHGWPFRDGPEGQDPSVCSAVTPTAGPCVDPVLAYPHSETPSSGSGSVTGGVFSNHCSWPEAYRGRYWFGDYSKNRVWMLTPNAARDGIVGGRTVIVRSAGGPVHFFNGADGAVYYLSIADGEIHRIGPAGPGSCAPDGGVSIDAAPGDARPPSDAAAPNDAAPPPDAATPNDAGAAADARRADAISGTSDAEDGDGESNARDGGGFAGSLDPVRGDGCGCAAVRPAWAEARDAQVRAALVAVSDREMNRPRTPLFGVLGLFALLGLVRGLRWRLRPAR